MSETSRMREIVILGSTGSIGVQALEIVAANPDRFRVVGLSSHMLVLLKAFWLLKKSPDLILVPSTMTVSPASRIPSQKLLRSA